MFAALAVLVVVVVVAGCVPLWEVTTLCNSRWVGIPLGNIYIFIRAQHIRSMFAFIVFISRSNHEIMMPRTYSFFGRLIE